MECTRLIRVKFLFKVFPKIFSEFKLDCMNSKRSINVRQGISESDCAYKVRVI